LLALLTGIFNNIYSQEQKYATIYIYRPKKFILSAVDVQITFNDYQICKLKNNTKLKYKVYSEGKLKIKAFQPTETLNRWNIPITINIKHGKAYYLKINATGTRGIELLNNQDNGEAEYLAIEDNKLISIEEDINEPITEGYNKISTNTVKTDTVKQIIYVNTEQQKYIYKPISDIDNNIPVNSLINDKHFAIIIGNEDYTVIKKI